MRVPGVDLPCGSEVGEEADHAPEELDLVDGLRGTHATGLHRPVRGEHDQRDGAVGGLDHSRGQVGDRGPRRADHRDRLTGNLRHPEGEEPGRALVHPHVQADAAGALQT